MRSAPSVTYPVGRSRLAGRLLSGLWLLGALAFVAWCLQAAMPSRQGALLALALVAAGAGALHAARLGVGMRLHWDGRAWHVEGRPALSGAGATVHLDLQSLLLVRLRQPGGRAVWAWAERAADPLVWLALRRALYAHAPAAGVSAARAPDPE